MNPDQEPDEPDLESQDDPPRWDADDQRRRHDCFAPPQVACECWCMHCGRTFMSDQIWLQKVRGGRDDFEGFWMCPTPNCDGAGFTFDIFPTDPEHPANEGWQTFDEDDEELSEDADGEFVDLEETEHPKADYDPDEPFYRSLDENDCSDEALEGEEWKHGLQPGERPIVQPPPEGVEPANQAEQEALYNAPDRRPREIEREEPAPRPRATEGDGPRPDEDIPF